MRWNGASTYVHVLMRMSGHNIRVRLVNVGKWIWVLEYFLDLASAVDDLSSRADTDLTEM